MIMASYNDRMTSEMENSSGDVGSQSYYCLVGNIPKSFHASDLRNYFAAFVEEEKFKCFHFRHRPQVITVDNINLDMGESVNSSTKEVLCALVQFDSDQARMSFLTKYKGLYWMDKEGNGLQGRCVIQLVKMSNDEFKKFSKELSPPKFMPRGNVGTCTQHFLSLIKQCRLPPSLIKKLGLEFPLGRRYKEYSKVPFDYGTKLVEDNYVAEEVFTRRGQTIPDVYIPNATCRVQRSDGQYRDRNDDNSSSEEDDDRCEEWERHEALHEDVTSQERLKERLYEEEIEVVWEKGGPGIVWHTDAQYWQAQEGGFDEQTSDDLDVDMEVYYVPGGGDSDARTCLEMRRRERFQKGIENMTVFRRTTSLERKQQAGSKRPRRYSPERDLEIGRFESFTKGFGRKVLEQYGWRDGQGLGKNNAGIKDALFNDGQGPMDKRGIGYYGEKLSFGTRRPKHISNTSDKHGFAESSSDTFEAFEGSRIGTIFDNPNDLDKNEPTLRSNNNTFIRRYSSHR